MPNIPEMQIVVNEGSKSGNERTGETSFTNCFTRFDLQDFLVVPTKYKGVSSHRRQKYS
jgi:hypothetical protein